MAEKYRSLQLLRNAAIAEVANHGEARSNFAQVSLNNVQDGEIILYSYTIKDEEVSTGVHTLVGVVRENNSKKHLEILGNYDFLHNEIVNALDEAKTYTDTTIDALDTTITNHVEGGKEPVIVSITQTDGLLTSVTVDVKNLSDNFQEIINALDYTHTNVNTSGTEFKIHATNQADGKISEVVDGTIYFTDPVTNDNPGATQKYVDDKIADLDTPEGGVSSEADQNILVTVEQENGIVTSVSVDETALNAKFDELEAATTLKGVEAIKVSYGETTNTVSLKIAEGEKVLSQSDAGLKSTIALTYDNTTTKIKLTGINGADLGTIDASEFVKDGLLTNVTIVTGEGQTVDGQELIKGHKYFKFVYKTVFYDENGDTKDTEKVVYLDVESLVDAYTADETWIHIDQDTNTISHKTIDGLDTENVHGSITRKDTGVTGNNLTNAGESIQLAVPIVEVDAAGHVTRIDEYTTIITLPASIATAVQTVKAAQTEVLSNTKFVAVKTERTDNDVLLTTEYRTQAVKDATADQDGLATAADVKEYVAANSTTVSTPDNNPVEVSETTNDNGSTNYQVELSAIEVEKATATTNSMANTTNTHTYMTGIETDGFGRVTKVLTETMTENIDCGLY